MKIVYYTYIAGLLSLILDIVGTLVMKGNIFMLFTIFRFFLPIAGIAGIVPYPILFFYGAGYYPLTYLTVFPIIFFQKKVVDRLKVAIAKNQKRDIVFRIVVLHHLMLNIFLIPAPMLGLFNREWGLNGFSKTLHGYPILWIFCATINLLITIGVWSWVKSR